MVAPADKPTAAQLDVIADASLRQLAAQGQVRAYPKGAVIITEGDPGELMFVTLSGRVKIFVADRDGREMVLDTPGPGACLGEMTLDGGPRTASAMCLEPCTFSVVTRASLREAIGSNRDLAMQVIAVLIDRARLANDLVRNLALMDVYGRVAHLLLQLAEDEGNGELVVRERLTQQEIADRVGASRDMVNRILRDLTAGGYLVIEKKRIILKRRPPARW